MSWLTGWDLRIYHEIVGAAGAGVDYQIKIIVHKGFGLSYEENAYCNNLCKNDFGDIRFTKSDGETEEKYWLESYVSGDYAIFWIKISDNLNNSTGIYMYFANPEATTTSDIINTWIFSDEFDAIDPDIWTEFEENPSYSYVDIFSNSLRLVALSLGQALWSYAGIISVNTFGPEVKLRWSSSYSYSGNTGNIQWSHGIMGEESHGYQNIHNYLDSIRRRAGTLYPGDPKNAWDCMASKNGTELQITAFRGTPSVFQTSWALNRIQWFENDILTAEHTNSDYILDEAFPIKFEIGKGAETDARTDYVDWMVLGKYVFPEPINGYWEVLPTDIGITKGWEIKIYKDGEEVGCVSEIKLDIDTGIESYFEVGRHTARYLPDGKEAITGSLRKALITQTSFLNDLISDPLTEFSLGIKIPSKIVETDIILYLENVRLKRGAISFATGEITDEEYDFIARTIRIIGMPKE